MELRFGLLQILFSLTVFMLMILKLLKHESRKPNLPPGPRKLPIIGSIHHLVGSLPHHRLRDLAKKHGSLMHLQLGELSVFVASSPYIAKQVMQTHDVNFANRPFHRVAYTTCYNGAGIILSSYGEYWRQFRKICHLEFWSNTQVQTFRSIREEEVSKFINSISQNPVNLSKSIPSLTYGITARAAFGKKCKDQDAFISFVSDNLAVVGEFGLEDFFPSSSKLLELLSGSRSKLEKIHQGYDQILNSVIEEHKTTSDGDGDVNKDLVDILLQIQERGEFVTPLSINDIKAVILDVFVGSGTSSVAVEWAMSELVKNPEVMEKAQAEVRKTFDRRGSFDEAGIQELEFLRLVIKETLRLHPPGPLLIPRENMERCEINGFEIPAKSRIIVNAWAINRDPDIWDDPESFHPERFRNSTLDYQGTDFKYTPFGAGRRICPGISFGLAVVELQLASLLYHFDWKPADGTDNKDLDMTEAFGVTNERKNDLVLIPTVYKPAHQM